MPSHTRQNRFQSFTPLRRLRTAFSPVRSLRSISPSSSSSTTTSPLTRTASPDNYHNHTSATAGSPDSYGSTSSTRSIQQLRSLLQLRRKPSVLEFEMEEEAHLFGHELEMLEPRPRVGGYGGVEMAPGIFEVLSLGGGKW